MECVHHMGVPLRHCLIIIVDKQPIIVCAAHIAEEHFEPQDDLLERLFVDGSWTPARI